MNPDVKRLWTNALLSGDYKQAQHHLRKSGVGYCCLGVLCDIAPEELGSWEKEHGLAISWISNVGRKISNRDFPPQSILDWAGISFEQANALASLNDEEGADFPTIATFIEEKF